MKRKSNAYERELRKLLLYDEDIAEPVSLYGRDVARMARVARNMLPSEFDHMSDNLLRILTQETQYCALERIAILTMGKARMDMNYEYDSDWLVQQTKTRLKQRLRNLSYFKRKGMGEMLERVANHITSLSLFLFFGAELRLNGMNNSPSLFGKLNHKHTLCKLVSELFPSNGYRNVGVFDESEFVERFLSFALWLNIEWPMSNNNSVIFTLNIINPSLESIKTQKLWFLALSDSDEELRRMLSACIAVNSESYIQLALTEFGMEQNMLKKDEETKRLGSKRGYETKLEKRLKQLTDNQTAAEELINEALADIEAKNIEISQLKSRIDVQFLKIRQLMKNKNDLTMERDELSQEVEALREQLDASEQFYGKSGDETLLQRIARCLNDYECTCEASNNMADLMAKENEALALFSSVAEICTIINHQRSERAARKSAESKQQANGGQTITITNYHGSIITGDAVLPPKKQTDESQPLTLTERQQELFDEAVSRGFMSKTPTGYEWKLSPTLLDYFLGRAFCDDYAEKGSEGYVVWCYGKDNKPLPVAQLRQLFGNDNIGNIRRQRQCKSAPKDRKVIDELFES